MDGMCAVGRRDLVLAREDCVVFQRLPRRFRFRVCPALDTMGKISHPDVQRRWLRTPGHFEEVIKDGGVVVETFVYKANAA